MNALVSKSPEWKSIIQNAAIQCAKEFIAESTEPVDRGFFIDFNVSPGPYKEISKRYWISFRGSRIKNSKGESLPETFHIQDLKIEER